MNNYLKQMADDPSLILNIPQLNPTGELTGYKELPICVSDDSYRSRVIMGEHMLSLKFSLPGYYNIPIGTYCEYQGLTYTLETPENVTKNGERNYEYTLVMQSDQYKLGKFIIRNTIPGDSRLKFSYTARPHEFMQLLVDNMNMRDPEEGWSFDKDNIVESFEKTVSFNHNTCLDALRMIAEAFETEWEVAGKTILLRKMEYFKDNPLSLSYGRGNGFLPGVGRMEFSDVKPVERLFTQGGDRNIDASKYRREESTGQVGSRELLMPINTKIKYDGVYFEDEAEFNPDSPDVREYITDESGASVTNVTNASYKGLIEGSLDLTGVYPMREGTVASVIPVDPDKNFYDFTDGDAGIPDYNKYQIPGETMTVIFQTGMLTSREFDVIYKHPGHFQIVPQTIDGVDMPNAQFQPRVGDKYAIFNVMMPDEYIIEAERNMLKQAVKHLYDYELPRFTFRGEVDGIWARRNWVNVGGRLRLGGYIRFTDNQFLPEGVNVRITTIRDHINNPYKPKVELSNSTQSGSWQHNMKRQIAADEVTAATQDRDIVRFAKRRFRDVQQTTEMLQNSMLNFSESINPITVQTMQLVAGDESLQFDYSEPRGDFQFFPEEGIMLAPSGRLTHRTLGVNFISSESATKNLWYWDMPQYVSAVLDDPDKSYYLYARVDIAPTGIPEGRQFLLSENAIAMEAELEEGYLHLLVGILNSEWGGDRSFSTLYGYTEILPGRITTDLIKSSDGSTYFDLAKMNTLPDGTKTYGEIGGRVNFRNGLVSGDVGIGNAQGINAGMNGAGNSGTDVRLWAGATAANKANAPFRVQHDGSLYATKASITGEINATSGVMEDITINIGEQKNKMVFSGTENAALFYNSYGTLTGKISYDANFVNLVLGDDEIGKVMLSRIGLFFDRPPTTGGDSSKMRLALDEKSIYISSNGTEKFNVRYTKTATNAGTLELMLRDLPTSKPPLAPSGTVWRDGEILKIVP